MKVGILTTFFSKNYGAALQAYATYIAVENMNCDSEFINYKNTNVTHYRTIYSLNMQKNMNLFAKIIQKFRNLIIKIKKPNRDLVNGSALRNQEFEEFVKKYLKLSNASYTSPDEFSDAVPEMPYDIFLSGSDQIWNPIVHNFDDVYYLNFPTKAKKVAYASSVAYNNFAETEIMKICEAIKSIDSISVREKSTMLWMQAHMEKKISHVIDPTFLLTKKDWENLKSEKIFDGKYILVYVLNYNEQNKKIPKLVGDMARKNGYKIICLPYTTIRFPMGVKAEYRYDIAPNDFIQLLIGAKCVITNSFHATALSINLNIPFYVVSSRERNKDMQTRLSDLLEETGLEDRKIYPDTNSISVDDKIDYESVNKIISKRREAGLEYLKQALEYGE